MSSSVGLNIGCQWVQWFRQPFFKRRRISGAANLPTIHLKQTLPVKPLAHALVRAYVQHIGNLHTYFSILHSTDSKGMT